jgi:hypothetical protein
MAVLRDKKTGDLVFAQGQLLLKKKRSNFKFKVIEG